MTTITNFLMTNFLDSKVDQKQKQEYEVPLWVVNGSRDKNIKALIQYMIDNCINTNKTVIRLDFGISVLKLCRDCQNKVVVHDGLHLVMPNKDKPYYILTLTSSFRSNTNISIPAVMKTLINISNYVKDTQTNKPKSSIALIIEGLQIVATQKNGPISLQTFINHIPSLNPIFKQITVFKYGDILLPEHQFALERISTCLTDLEQYDTTSATWLVKSTVRRLTGFSNQEKYTIKTMKNNKLKVDKWVANKSQQQTQSHKQMVSELGFVVKKNDKVSKTQELKKMIYPHLRMQVESCKCNKNQCITCTVEDSSVEGLIVLDDEQQDDDDIDV